MALALMTPTIDVAKSDVAKRISIEDVNKLDFCEFTAFLGKIYEHSPWVAEKTFEQRPFIDLDSLHNAMSQIVKISGKDKQRDLIKLHPQLAGKAASIGALTDYSTEEQRSTGLCSSNSEQIEKINELNKNYKEKFDFPFVIALKGLDVNTVLDAFSERLENSQEDEFERALVEINKIARFRLEELFSG